jgi:hypothetical protein
VEGMNKPIHKEGSMGKNQIISLFTVVLFLFCVSCTSQSLPDKVVTILSPKANDVLKAGELYDILWKAEPSESEFGAMVTVEFSKDGGKSWQNVEENVPNSGKYMWIRHSVRFGFFPSIDRNIVGLQRCSP